MGRKRSEVAGTIPDVVPAAMNLETPVPDLDYENPPPVPGYQPNAIAAPEPALERAVDEDDVRRSSRKTSTIYDAVNSDYGQTVEVTWGKEYFQPVQFHGVDVGPFTARTIVRTGETIGSAVIRAYEELDEVARVIRTKKQNSFVDSMSRLRDEVARR